LIKGNEEKQTDTQFCGYHREHLWPCIWCTTALNKILLVLISLESS